MGYYVDSRRQELGGEQALGQVLQAVAPLEAEQNHRSRKDNWKLKLRQVSRRALWCSRYLNSRIQLTMIVSVATGS